MITRNNSLTKGTSTITFYKAPFVNLQSVESNAPEIRVFPNPTDGVVNIEINNNIHSIENPYYSLIGLDGTIVCKGKITELFPNGQTVTVDISPIPNGIYLLEILGLEHQPIFKVIVKK